MNVLDPKALDDSTPGLTDELAKVGLPVEQVDGVWVCKDPLAVDAFIKAYDPTPRARADAIAKIRAAALAQVQALFPALKTAEEVDLEYHRWASIGASAKQATVEYGELIAIWAQQIADVEAVRSAEVKA